jgi:hypothetical protein
MNQQRRFTLGLTVEHFDLRVDLHRLIEVLSARVDVVVFANRPFSEPIKGLKEVRLYRPRRSFMGGLVMRIFYLTRRLPLSRDNFFITEYFKLAGLPPRQRRRGLVYLAFRRIFPGGLSLDAVLPWLGRSDETPLEDVDAFLHVTQILALSFLQRALTSGKPNGVYVYSWDHPCKHTTIPRRGPQAYFTWNRGQNEDLAYLQGVDPAKCHEVGTTQLSPLKQYLETPAARQRLIPYDYVYYGCGTAVRELVAQEVLVIRWLAGELRRVAPGLTLLVRPYPFLADWDPYEPLRHEPNVQMDAYREAGRVRALTPQEIFEKYNKVEHARAFVHLGTTLGYEACYFGPPVLFLTPEDMELGRSRRSLLHLSRSIHQYHCDRYLMPAGYANVVRRQADLSAALRGVLENPADWLGYNRAVAGLTPLRSLEEIAEDILGRLMAAAGAPASADSPVISA